MKLFGYKKYQIRIGFIYGLKQKPKETEFHITPCITADKYISKERNSWAYGFGIEWGFWAISIALFYLGYLNED